MTRSGGGVGIHAVATADSLVRALAAESGQQSILLPGRVRA